MRSHACARCGEASPRWDEDRRRAGWKLLDLASHEGAAGGYTLLSWFCPGCAAAISNRSQIAS